MKMNKLTRGTNIMSNLTNEVYLYWCKKPNKVTGEMQMHLLHFNDHKERWIMTESHFNELLNEGSIEVLKKNVYHL